MALLSPVLLGSGLSDTTSEKVQAAVMRKGGDVKFNDENDCSARYAVTCGSVTGASNCDGPDMAFAPESLWLTFAVPFFATRAP